MSHTAPGRLREFFNLIPVFVERSKGKTYFRATRSKSFSAKVLRNLRTLIRHSTADGNSEYMKVRRFAIHLLCEKGSNMTVRSPLVDEDFFLDHPYPLILFMSRA